ncbi:DUF1176 domain-containing protein [Telluria beijingensis]|uniref:DUF1176 domain-containing protein n=1 Tax=Telluria beijingensis TaxID=3068633 RepID=UPI00279545E1|nr:DUF1176 domain-containing protein [Massilia sp. REN29]
MRFALIPMAALAAANCLVPLQAAELPQLRFQHHDWELACDNTRTCRAAGYHPEDGRNPPLTVLLERKAGPGQAFDARLRLGDADDAIDLPTTLAMQVDGRALGTVTLDREEAAGNLSASQSQALLRAVASTGKVAWRAGGRSWTLSGKGASAVLLKMDEFQGRLGTPGAAIRKGGKNEQDVLPALPAPVVAAAAVPAGELPRLGKEEERILLATLRKTAGNDDCADLEAIATGETQFSYAPLTRDKMLVSARCWRGAYNEGHGYWVANRKPPFAPQLVTQSGTDYDQGVIGAAHKGRGIGDCWGHDEWTWDGRQFIHTGSSTTGMCRGIAAGGGWTLPTLVSRPAAGAR